MVFLSLQDMLRKVERPVSYPKPSNFTICSFVEKDMAKKQLSAKQWCLLASEKLNQNYWDYFTLYTDASKQSDGRTGIELLTIYTLKLVAV